MSNPHIGEARQVVLGVYEHYGRVVSVETVIRESIRQMRMQPDLLDAATEYGIERLFGEIERKRRRSGLRAGERALSSTGEQLSLSLLDMTFPQAWASSAKKQTHAQGALAEARFDAKIIALAEVRARERGIDPATTEMVVGQFIGEDEIEALRKAS